MKNELSCQLKVEFYWHLHDKAIYRGKKSHADLIFNVNYIKESYF